MNANLESFRAGLGWVAIASLAVMVVIGGAARIAKLQLQPQLGDMIVFDSVQGTVIGPDASIPAIVAGGSARRRCILNPSVMQRYGGSMVIEAVSLRPLQGYRVQWLGLHTSDPATDCGTSAHLELTPDELGILSLAAGGWGLRVSPAHTKPGIGRRVR